MRMLMQVSIPVEAGNAAARSGKLGSTIQKILEELKPEAAYFTTENGERNAFLVFDMQKSSQMTAIAEPWFLSFNARITTQPVMSMQDLAEGSAGIEKAVKEYGKVAA